MTGFSARVEQISISGIREVFEAAGSDAINMGIGQPDFPTPDHARAAAIDAINEGVVDGYTSNKGIEPLRAAISDKHARDNDLDIPVGNLIATAGGSEAVHLAMEAHVEPGDEVLIPDPGFVSYDALTRLAGGTPMPLELRDDLTLDPATVEAAITDDTSAFVVNSPANRRGRSSRRRTCARSPGSPTITTCSASATRSTNTSSSRANTARRWSSPRPTTSWS